MADETKTKLFRLICIEKDVAKKEGVITRESVDMKELLATGRYELVGVKKPKVSVDTEDGDDGDDGDDGQGESEYPTPDQVNQLTTAALKKLVDDLELEIEDFDGMNLKDKREAVNAAIADLADGLSEDYTEEDI